MNNNIIVLDGNIDNLTQDCTYAKIREGNKDTIALKQYTAGNQKTSTIYLTKEEILKLVNELTEPNGLPRKFKFKSTVKGMDQIIYRRERHDYEHRKHDLSFQSKRVRICLLIQGNITFLGIGRRK